jgi:hypothetical protein
MCALENTPDTSTFLGVFKKIIGTPSNHTHTPIYIYIYIYVCVWVCVCVCVFKGQNMK